MTIGYKGDVQDLLIRQGATFKPILNLTDGTNPVDVSGLTFRAQIRKTFDDPIVVANFSVTVLDAVNGQIELYIADEVTETITAADTETNPISQYVWDLEAEDLAGDVYPFLYGSVSVFREVTK